MPHRPSGMDASTVEEDRAPIRSDFVRTALFALAVILLFAFGYANTFMLPLGGCSVSSVIDDADDLYGVRLEIIGAINNSSSSGFDLTDVETGERIYVAWLGVGDLPFDGTVLRVYGQLVGSAVGPALLAGEFQLVDADDQILSSAWSPAVFRWFAIFVIGFVVMVSISSLLVSASHLSRRVAPSGLLHASSEVSSVLGIVAISLFSLLILSEQLVLATSSLFLVLSWLLMIASMIMRESKEHWISLFTDAMPLIATATIAIWLLLSVIQDEMFIVDSISALLWRTTTDSIDSILAGVFGISFLSLYVLSVRSDIAGIEGRIELLREEVK